MSGATDWSVFVKGMEAARASGDVGAHFTMEETRAAGGPDFEREAKTDKQMDWHMGYDYAIWLARQGRDHA